MKPLAGPAARRWMEHQRPMKNSLTLLIAAIIVLVLLSYMFLFQVRYDQVAVLTTFGKAGPNSKKEARPWPYLRWPWPIQGVTRYSHRLHVLEDQLEELQTADGYAVITETYLAWQIEDPLKFFALLQDVERAEDQLRQRMRDARSVFGKYRFDQLVNADAEQVMIHRIEEQVQEQIAQQVSDDDYGIRIRQFGIRRIKLPEKVTENVFEQMRETRSRMAQNTRSQGDAEARRITSHADQVSAQILAFAEGHAEQIKARGDREAQEYFDVYDQDESFAIFIRRLKAMEKIYKDATFILPAEPLLSPDQAVVGPKITAPAP